MDRVTYRALEDVLVDQLHPMVVPAPVVKYWSNSACNLQKRKERKTHIVGGERRRLNAPSTRSPGRKRLRLPSHSPLHLLLPCPHSTALTFTSGVVELSFLLSIHQDGEAHETGEYFDLILYQPWGGARLGAQQRTRVTIVDANSYNGTSAMTDHRQTFFHDGGDDTFNARDRAEMGGKSDIFVRAGRVNNATIVAKDSSGRGRGYGGDLHAIWVESMGFGDDEGDDDKEDSSLHLTVRGLCL